jgi:hypothetical protein
MEIDIAARSRQWRQFRTRRFAASTLSHTRWNSPLPTEGDYDEVSRDVSFVIGVLVAPIAAQAQQSLPGSPQGFNGLVWDPPAQTYVTPDATK